MERGRDRRKARSRGYMEAALLDLMQTKDFQNITVNDITERACISRSTFYFQFEDKYFFLERIIDDMLSDLRRETSPARGTEFSLTLESRRYYERYFSYIFDHAGFFRAMLGPHGTPLFRKKPEESAYITYRDIFSRFGARDMASLDYFIQYIISAHIGVTVRWIHDGLREPPAVMAELLTKLTFYGLLHGLEMDQEISLPK